MAKLSEVKSILDSVHGQIKVPKIWCERIIDTTYFQRLRRIEQNSCRSVFPSARHDRFIHSLGVYHIGGLIVAHLNNEYVGLEADNRILPDNYESIFYTYRLACLLHDVGHTPFSHTFEIFFNEKEMRNALSAELKDEKFTSDIAGKDKPLTEHEVLSAYVSVKIFRDKFDDDPLIDWPLLVRMIIGLPYLDDADQPDNKRFENIMIELIHGTIDADGLDYVCRDVWAGGYHNFSIDLPRLIESIVIINDDGNYTLAFSSKALNEIEGVLNIKNFQFLYVINHHKVLVEQEYLKEAMKAAAIYHTGIQDKEEAIKNLCDFKAFVEVSELKASHYKLYRPCDDDFVVMMKYIPEHPFIKGWFSRKFKHKSLWKSKMAFFETFSDILYKIDIPIEKQQANEADSFLKRARLDRIEAICGKICKEYVCRELNLADEDVIQVKIEPKVRRINPEKVKVLLDKKVKKFSELIHDSFSVTGEHMPFSFWYVNLEKIEGEDFEAKRRRVIEKICDYVKDPDIAKYKE